MNETVKLTAIQEAFASKLLRPINFFLFTLRHLPIANLAGLKLVTLNGNQCQTTIPYKFLNKNPFKSTYFAVQSMAAEASTAALAMVALRRHTESIAFIIVDLKATFSKKTTSKVTFTCNDGAKFAEGLEKLIQTNQPVEITAKTIGRIEDGTEVATFHFTWSFKIREEQTRCIG